MVDGGAVAALRERGRSLLPAGVAQIAGTFVRGESVEVRDVTGARIAAGTTNYASDELARIRGLRSDRIAETLGYAYGDEVIHRDDFVPLGEEALAEMGADESATAGDQGTHGVVLYRNRVGAMSTVAAPIRRVVRTSID